MSVDSIVTIAIGLLAALYAGVVARRSIRNLLAPRAKGTCGGCASSACDDDTETETKVGLVQIRLK